MLGKFLIRKCNSRTVIGFKSLLVKFSIVTIAAFTTSNVSAVELTRSESKSTEVEGKINYVFYIKPDYIEDISTYGNQGQ